MSLHTNMSRAEVLHRYETFRDKCQPNLYDFFNAFKPYHLVSCCAWGQAVDPAQSTGGTNSGQNGSSKSVLGGPFNPESANCLRQEIYFGTRADEFSTYNKSNNQKWLGGPASLLAVGEVDIAKQGYQLEQSKGRISMEREGTGAGQGSAYQQFLKGQQAKLKVKKILIHPGEINSFKSWPMNRKILASHSDHNEIFVWDMNLQQCVGNKHKTEPSLPNMILIGHSSQPTYALGWSNIKPIIASGNRTGQIILWDL